jgi:hypothetical protein
VIRRALPGKQIAQARQDIITLGSFWENGDIALKSN